MAEEPKNRRTKDPKAFAVIPAAGLSTRMGAPKLLLAIDGRPLILHTLDAWKQSRVHRIVVVVRPDDAALTQVLRTADVDVVVPPLAPPDMKASLRYGVAHIAAAYWPADEDVWLVAPADMPGLSWRVIDELLSHAGVDAGVNRRAQAALTGRILIPMLAGHGGHPVLLPWRLAAELDQLAENEGLSALIARNDPLLIPCDHVEPQTAASFADIDTPQDLAQFDPRAHN